MTSSCDTANCSERTGPYSTRASRPICSPWSSRWLAWSRTCPSYVRKTQQIPTRPGRFCAIQGRATRSATLRRHPGRMRLCRRSTREPARGAGGHQVLRRLLRVPWPSCSGHTPSSSLAIQQLILVAFEKARARSTEARRSIGARGQDSSTHLAVDRQAEILPDTGLSTLILTTRCGLSRSLASLRTRLRRRGTIRTRDVRGPADGHCQSLPPLPRARLRDEEPGSHASRRRPGDATGRCHVPQHGRTEKVVRVPPEYRSLARAGAQRIRRSAGGRSAPRQAGREPRRTRPARPAAIVEDDYRPRCAARTRSHLEAPHGKQSPAHIFSSPAARTAPPWRSTCVTGSRKWNTSSAIRTRSFPKPTNI